MSALRRACLSVPLSLCLAACAGGNLASEIASKPEYSPNGQTKSQVEKSSARPLIVEWPSADRAALEAEMKGAIVIVRYDGSTIEVLSDCHAAGGYAYTATTPLEDRETVRDVDDLHAKLPLGAAGLAATLARTGALDVSMTIVGRYKADHATVRAADLAGPSCERATHAVMALSAGAFEMFAGAQAEVGAGAHVEKANAGASSTSNRELLNKAGDKAVCAKATADDKAPPFGCGALIRIEVTPIAKEAGQGTSTVAGLGTSTPAGLGTSAPAGASTTGTDATPKPSETSAPASSAVVEEGHYGTLPPGTVQSVINGAQAKMRTCYINGLSSDPKLRGQVRVALVIGAEGNVTSAGDDKSTLPDKDVVGCIANVLKQVKFPKPTGGSVRVVVPIMFSPEGSGDLPD